MRKPLVILVLAVPLLSGCGKMSEGRGEARLDHAIGEGDWQRIRETANTGQARYPNDPFMAFLRWEASWHLGDVQGTVAAGHVLVGTRQPKRPDLRVIPQWVAGLTKRNPDSARAWQVAADGYRWSGQYDEAEKAAKEAVRLGPEDWASWAVRGMTEKDQGAAVKDFTRGLSCKPAAAYLYGARARAYLALGEVDQGVADVNREIELAPRAPSPHGDLAQVYLGRRQLDRALAEANREIGLDPDGDGGYSVRSCALCALGDFKSALRDANKFVELLPWDFAGFDYRAEIYAGLGDWEQAMRDANRAIDLDDRDWNAYLIRGEAYRKMHDLTHAVSDLTCCLELVPEYVRAYCARGLARAEQGEREAAQNDLGRALALSPEYTRAILKQNQKTLESEHVWPVVPVGASKGK